MASRRSEGSDFSVDDVVRWGQFQKMGVIKEIRVIDTAKLVQKFLGEEDAVMLRIRTELGMALIWPKEHEISKVNEHDAKEFRSRMKQNENGK